jgi:hypothetical protein
MYPPEFRAALADHGLAPRPDTPPALVRDAVDELYKFELKRLRLRHLRGDVAKADFADRVVQLRKKYWLLTLSADAWKKICAV